QHRPFHLLPLLCPCGLTPCIGLSRARPRCGGCSATEFLPPPQRRKAFKVPPVLPPNQTSPWGTLPGFEPQPPGPNTIRPGATGCQCVCHGQNSSMPPPTQCKSVLASAQAPAPWIGVLLVADGLVGAHS